MENYLAIKLFHVPQGSILALLLFLLYINDLPDCLKSTTPGMYADDTQFFSSSNDANELVVRLNSDLAHVCNWLKENRLKMHPSKCKMMFIGSPWTSHIEMICKKASSGIGAIKRIKPFVPMHTLESVYKHVQFIC